MEKIAKQLLDLEIVKLRPNKPFIWASGWKSPIYCNNREALFYPELRKEIVQGMSNIIRCKYEPDMIVGVSTGAIAWGALVAESMNLPYASVRPEAKDHGMGGRIDGKVPAGAKVVVAEDLISTGGSSLKVVSALREQKAEVCGMVAIFTYQFPQAEQAFSRAECSLSTLTNYTELTNVAFACGDFGEEERRLLAAWRESPDKWGV